MPKFIFKAKNTKNELVQGARNADSDKDLVTILKNQGLIVFSIQQEKEASQQNKRKKSKLSGGGIKDDDIAIFCRQLSTMINAGISILDSINDLMFMVSSKKFTELLKEVSADITQGQTFSDAMKKHTKVFGKVFVSIIAAGEKSGQLGKVLLDLTLYLENSVKLKRKIKSASAYPIFMGGFFFVVVLALVLFLIPKFKAMFSQFGAQLPLPTRIVMAISDTVIKYFPFVVVLGIGAFVGIKFLLRINSVRLFIDEQKLKLPILGPILTKIVFARFFQTLATLIKSGTDIVSSLETACIVTDNKFMEQRINIIKNKVIEGSTLSEEMEKQLLFPTMIVRMTAIGEKSGSLDEMFIKISEYYTDEVDATVAIMSSLIEPVLIVSLGVVIGLVVIVMYLPIFKMATAMMTGNQGY